jgi:hypothetical protein
MSFAGHVFDMISRMKANARDKRRPFDREVEASGPAIRPEYLRKASEEELAYWRERALADQRRQRRIAMIILSALAAILLVFYLAL